MRKSTVMLSGISVVTVAASYWLWTQWQHERSLNSELQGLLGELQRPELPAAAAPASSPAPGSLTTPTPQATNNPKVAASAAPYSRKYPGELQQRLLKNPDYRKALRVQQRQTIEEGYRDLPRVLGLNQEQANRLFDLMSDQGVRLLEAQWQKPEEGKSRQSAYERVQAQNDTELADMLGASNMIRLGEFRSTLQSRSEVDSVRNELAKGAEPLRQDQVDSMVATVNAEVQRMNQELRDVSSPLPYGEDPIAAARRTEIVIATNQRILDSAKSILTSAQLAGLEQLYRRQRLQMESETELARLQFEATQNYASE